MTGRLSRSADAAEAFRDADGQPAFRPTRQPPHRRVAAGRAAMPPRDDEDARGHAQLSATPKLLNTRLYAAVNNTQRAAARPPYDATELATS